MIEILMCRSSQKEKTLGCFFVDRWIKVRFGASDQYHHKIERKKMLDFFSFSCGVIFSPALPRGPWQQGMPVFKLLISQDTADNFLKNDMFDESQFNRF